MIPYEDSDVRKINKLLNQLSCESQAAHLESHIKQWSRKKYNLYRMFGNKLKIEREVVSCLTDTKVLILVSEFIENHCGKDPSLSLVRMFLSELTERSLSQSVRENILEVDVSFFQHKFKKGMKISRILLQLCTKENSEKIQIEYSKVVQSMKVKGIATLSIDPADYITMSENKSNWRSCQSLDGEYRTAVLAYMMDSSTVVGYVSSSDFMNKSWRQLVYFNTENHWAAQSRQYPSKNANSASTISNMILEILGPDDFKVVKEETARVADYILDKGGDGEQSNLWYNDILRSTFEVCTVIIPKEYESITDIADCNFDIHVGVAEVLCACGCGESLGNGELLFHYEEEYDGEEDEDYDG